MSDGALKKDVPEKDLLIDLLTMAEAEIVSCHRRIEILEAKQSMIDLFATVFHSTPNCPSKGYGEDIAFMLRKAIVNMKGGPCEPPKAETTEGPEIYD